MVKITDKTDYSRFVRPNDEDQEIWLDHVEVHLVTHPVGQVKEMHVHDPPQDHIIVIRSGRMRWTVEDQSLDAGSGDVTVTPAGTGIATKSWETSRRASSVSTRRCARGPGSRWPAGLRHPRNREARDALGRSHATYSRHWCPASDGRRPGSRRAKPRRSPTRLPPRRRARRARAQSARDTESARRRRPHNDERRPEIEVPHHDLSSLIGVGAFASVRG